jgi:hypothetical protein
MYNGTMLSEPFPACLIDNRPREAAVKEQQMTLYLTAVEYVDPNTHTTKYQENVPVWVSNSPPIMKQFECGHLSDNQRDIAVRFTILADQLNKILPDNEQKLIALNKLLEANNAALRSRL